jgi:hypothetical protein
MNLFRMIYADCKGWRCGVKKFVAEILGFVFGSALGQRGLHLAMQTRYNSRVFVTRMRRGLIMARSVLVELTLPEEWRKYRLPRALHDRLQELLDRQDGDGKLSPRERKEAKALVELVDMLSLIKAQVQAKQSS